MPRRSKADELLEFEIAFYEKLVGAYPEFIDALIPLGNAYTRRGLYEKGLDIDLRLTRLRTADSIIWYNLACSYSLLNRVEDAFGALRRAFELGYADMDYLRKDPDLQNLRASTRYRELFNSSAPQPSG
jgi:tetratricopeptide (TPR) repeat protein